MTTKNTRRGFFGMLAAAVSGMGLAKYLPKTKRPVLRSGVAINREFQRQYNRSMSERMDMYELWDATMISGHLHYQRRVSSIIHPDGTRAEVTISEETPVQHKAFIVQ